MLKKHYESADVGTIILGKLTEEQPRELDLIKDEENLTTEEKLCEVVEY